MTAAGLLVVDKPEGITSHGVVAVVRRALGTRKVGHAGTLDPMATGVLVLGVERATRLLGHLMLHDKEYLATIRLGSSTVTDDREGEQVEQADPAAVAAVTEAQVRSGMAALTGPLLQVPTAVSAIKVDGKRAYARVRAGEDVELAARSVHVERFDLLAIRRSAQAIDVDVAVTCSTGTYVRALARDLGAGLGVGGHLTVLRRTRVGAFGVDEAIGLDALRASADPSAHLVGLDEAARRCFKLRPVSAGEADDVRHGRQIAWQGSGDLVALVDPAGHLLALAERKDDRARYLAVLAQ